VLGHHGLLAEREEQEGSRAVGVLHLTLVEARVTEERSLLVAEDARDWYAGQVAGGAAEHLARRADLGKKRTRDLHRRE
jgi:hypothetical protein